MSKFKVGDKVRRKIEEREETWTSVLKTKGFAVDDVFNVTSTSDNGDWIYIADIDVSGWDGDYFELADEAEFKVGDRVRCTEESNDVSRHIGVVVGYDSGEYICVEWHGYTDGHNCSGKAEDGHGWNVHKDSLELVSPKKELIETDMDTEDIKNFPKAVLVKAEKEAKKELAEDQEKIAVAEFKRLFARIDDKERELSRVQSELKDLRGKAAVAKK